MKTIVLGIGLGIMAGSISVYTGISFWFCVSMAIGLNLIISSIGECNR